MNASIGTRGRLNRADISCSRNEYAAGKPLEVAIWLRANDCALRLEIAEAKWLAEILPTLIAASEKALVDGVERGFFCFQSDDVWKEVDNAGP